MQYNCRRQLFSTLMAVLLLLPALGVQAQDRTPSDHGNYALKPVTSARLLNGTTDPSAWLMYGGNYQSWRFSPLTDINRDNVKHLLGNGDKPFRKAVDWKESARGAT